MNYSMKKLFTKHLIIRIPKLFLVLIIISGTQQSRAQLNPLAGIYFSNEYLGNPAMAGIEKGLTLNMGYRKQWSTIPGAPKTQSLTADYGTGKKVGLGLNIYTDEAGLIKRTRVMGTYSYHLPLRNENQKLRFGISFGFADERVLNENINGDQNDGSIGKFNEIETYMDGDIGLAYTTSKLTMQAAIPNMKVFLKKDGINGVADRSSFLSTVSYKFFFSDAFDGFGVEPKLAYRGVTGFSDIIDIGANFTVANGKASVMSVYHSSQSATLGMGAIIKNIGLLSANYTTSSRALSEYSSGNFQIALKLNLWKKKII